MRIFHLSDLHIGLKLYNRDLYEDQLYIFKEITKQAMLHNPDVIIIAGDIYDKAIPSAEAIDVFNAFIEMLTNALPNTSIMMISGNHDSASRIDNFRAVLKSKQIYMIGTAPSKAEEYIEKVTLNDEYGPVNFYLLPFVKPSMVKDIVGVNEDGNNLSYDESIRRLIKRENINQAERNVLISHQFYLPIGKNGDDIERMESEIRMVGNIDQVKADVLEAFDYAALGHIHKPMKVGSEYYRYCGTPIACSVSEAGQEKGIIMVDFKAKHDITTTVLKLEPLRKVRVIKGLYQDVLKESSNDYVKIILTDKNDLDVIDMQDRLRFNFPYLLDINREQSLKQDTLLNYENTKEMSSFELCKAFLKDLNDEELDILKDVINELEGA